ncbi:MAG: SDR family oxidoreductase [Prolixibacteraceae bacterium]|jgi:uncharacterized protein YbjT (DUF2867 family)
MTTKNDILSPKILLAGATGYLGGYVLTELIRQQFPTRVIARNTSKLKNLPESVEVLQARITHPDSLIDCCDSVDTVISTVGITRQKDGLTYMDVDFQANMNLLEEAKKSGVRKFIYVSVLNGEQMRQLKICEAKERFVEELKKSGLDYTVIRPNGFFSDMSEFFSMAQKGRIFLFGNGELKANPIHGEDLAQLVVKAISGNETEIKAGGPETLSQKQIAAIAFEVAGKIQKITFIPDWIRRRVLGLIKTFTGSKTYGPIEFFMTVMAKEMIAPEYGSHTLKAFYQELKEKMK